MQAPSKEASGGLEMNTTKSSRWEVKTEVDAAVFPKILGDVFGWTGLLLNSHHSSNSLDMAGAGRLGVCLETFAT